MHPAFRVGEEAISVSLKLHESDAMTLAGTPIERIVIEIGRTAVLLRTSDHKLAKMLLDCYNEFVTPAENVAAEFEIESHDGGPISSEQEVSVRWKNDQWIIERGDFRVRWSPRRRAGTIRQAASPFATDSALRIVHSLVLASEGGFLLHAASAIRNGRAFLFAGASGAGKTTISSLAPSDVVLLSDEISYIRREGNTYRAYGTPFTGELGRNGENVSAPVEKLFFLVQASSNGEACVGRSEAVGKLLKNILFFSIETSLIERMFKTAVDFASCVPAKNLLFSPEPAIWNLIA